MMLLGKVNHFRENRLHFEENTLSSIGYFVHSSRGLGVKLTCGHQNSPTIYLEKWGIAERILK